MSDFPPRKWNSDGTIKYIQNYCRQCLRLQQRERYNNWTPQTRRRRQQSNRTWHRRKRRQAGVPEVGARVVAHHKHNSSVRREPFAEWLREKLKTMNQQQLSHATGLPVRRIKAILDGYDYSGRVSRPDMAHKRKLRPVDFIDFETVDRALQHFGEPPSKIDELYPPELPSNQ